MSKYLPILQQELVHQCQMVPVIQCSCALHPQSGYQFNQIDINLRKFQRFRLRHRPAHSAFLDRATRLLENKWAKEKYEKALTQQTRSVDRLALKS